MSRDHGDGADAGVRVAGAGEGAVRRCPDHGVFGGEECLVCGDAGETVLGADRRTRLSKFLSGALRHFPGDAGVSLDDAGWTRFDDLVAAATEKYEWATRDRVAATVAVDPKGRFERDGDRVRAAYGHSVSVDLDAEPTPVPDRLYHGTTPDAADAIREEGLKPMGRQSVHLSETVDAARSVGRRRAADPVVFAVDAARLRADGREVTKRGAETYTTDRVPPEYIDPLDRDADDRAR